MDILNKLFPIILLFTISCAKSTYLLKQGIGQMHLLSQAEENEKVLKSASIDQAKKERIKKITELKKYFYSYFGRKETAIYNKTVFLEQEAVTYLVIASPYDEIKAHEEWFPFMGEFPYLGFFNQKDAASWATDLEEKGLITYTRPVYAYSTLGYFDDPILSSFFRWDDWELANVIFHELFHTVFFIKDEIDLNESLADYFAEELALQYFNFGAEKLQRIEKKMVMLQKINSMIRSKIGVLNARYLEFKNKGELSRDKAKTILQDFLVEFKEVGQKMCAEALIEEEDCLPLSREWNNASLAAFLTYEEESDRIKSLHKNKAMDLVQFLKHLEEQYEVYKTNKPKKDGEKIEFGEYFLGIKSKKS